MKEYTNKNLKVKKLLEMGDLDIRGIAAQNNTLSADEYFSKVEQFIKNAPQLKNILLSASNMTENMKALKELESKMGVTERTVNFADNSQVLNDLESIQFTLTEIGYTKINFDIESISNAVKNGNLALAESLASETFMKFNALFDRLRSAYVVKKFVTTTIADGPVKIGRTVLLTEALAYLDHLEATRKMRVLAVDDVSIILNLISSVLSPHYEVFALKSSSQVASFLMHTTPELFLLDIEMSEINGFDLVPLIRQFSEHKNTPIIFLTGNASLNNLKDAMALGACDFITKPVDRDILLEKIQKNIVRKKAY